MIHSVRFTCILDANVLFPIDVRDVLFWFAHYDMYTPKWGIHVTKEWEKVMHEKGLSDEQILNAIHRANAAFPDALVEHYHELIDTISLPDQNDRHVVAAAIKTNANVIVTNNLKDFPNEYLAQFGLSVKSPDDFITDLIDLNHELALQAFKEMVLHRTNPDLDEYEVLDILRNRGLTQSANYLHSLI
ncbi:PIN domain-containing protein [Phaeocystidibacter luteus]|uniref:PIN domain-containing protein n=1 Tax=Phaeocystidibacter luteus TaxID=911197 RepID=A0A6N6RJ03_9FLAO|nr:PIN domain-containing protein [Phaeocystidibacter luteus]KAB2813946.1 PIN domain-containing protein [Phaeocystidibacter luteus]